MFAPLALAQLALPRMPDGGAIINVTSDAAVEPYEGWGGYGSSKAALEQLTAILAAEQPSIRVYAVDPGDMRTRMHQEAFPGEDISDRPPPEESVPGLLALIEGDAAERPLPRPGARRWSRRMNALAFELPSALEAREPPEARGARARRGPAAWSPTGSDGEIDARAVRRPSRPSSRPGDLLVVNVSATLPAAVGRDARSDGSRGARALLHAALRDSTTAGAWSRSAAPTARGRAGGQHGRAARRSTAVRELELVAPYASGARLMLARLRTGSAPSSDTSRATASRSATATYPPLAADRLPERVRDRRPEAPRCRARAGRSPPS